METPSILRNFCSTRVRIRLKRRRTYFYSVPIYVYLKLHFTLMEKED